MAKSHVLSLFVCAAVGAFMIQEVVGRNHIVGKSYGWSVPRVNASFYQDWAASRNFTVGDKLVFLYSSGVHNVLEVPKAEYEACTQTETISAHYSGPTTIRLERPGDHYFICGVRRHCFGGQKLSIQVAESTDPTFSGANSPEFSASFGVVSVLLIHLLFLFV